MGLAPENFTKKIVKVDLKNTTNRSYIIYPQRKTTEPAPLSPLKFLDSRYQEFLTKIGQLQLSQIYKVFDRKLLKDEVSRWNIMVDTGTNYELILYHKYVSQSHHACHQSLSDRFHKRHPQNRSIKKRYFFGAKPY